MHDTSVQVNTDFLENQKISLVCGGGIASIEAPKLARELRRHGASVQFYITEACLKFVGLESLRWASQNEVILNPSGLVEHICTSDAVVVAPATADLISKTQKIIDEINLQNLTYKGAAKLTSATDHDGIIQAKSMLNKYKLNAIFWNSAKNAWNLEKPHSGVFIEKIESKSFEKNMLGKNDVAKHFYYSFIKSV